MYSTYITVLRYFSLHKAPLNCLLTVSKVSVVRDVRLTESIVTVKGLKNGRDQHQVFVVLERVDCIF